MSTLAMFVCNRCEKTAKRAFKLKMVHAVIVGLLLVNLSILGYVTYRLFGAELVCTRSALDILDQPKEPE